MKVVTQVEIVDRPGRPPPLLRHVADLDLQGPGCLKVRLGEVSRNSGDFHGRRKPQTSRESRHLNEHWISSACANIGHPSGSGSMPSDGVWLYRTHTSMLPGSDVASVQQAETCPLTPLAYCATTSPNALR